MISIRERVKGCSEVDEKVRMCSGYYWGREGGREGGRGRVEHVGIILTVRLR